jgi:hypothetical protein
VDAGLAILRQGEGKDASCVVMDYGPHGGDSGGHGHYDKLSITLFANGREWLLDPGRLDYSHPEYKTWVKTTAAHNTVTLGGKSQLATTGKLLWLKNGEGWSACAAESDGAYPGIPGAVLRRYLLLTPEFLVDVFEAESDKETQIDWFTHATADKVQAGHSMNKADPVKLGDTDGYQHLTDARAWGPVTGVKPWEFVAGGRKLALHFVSPPGEEVFTCFGIGYTVAQKTPTLVRRVKGKAARFVTVYELGPQDQHHVQKIEAETDEKKPARVSFTSLLPHSSESWRIEFSREGVNVKR